MVLIGLAIGLGGLALLTLMLQESFAGESPGLRRSGLLVALSLLGAIGVLAFTGGLRWGYGSVWLLTGFAAITVFACAAALAAERWYLKADGILRPDRRWAFRVYAIVGLFAHCVSQTDEFLLMPFATAGCLLIAADAGPPVDWVARFAFGLAQITTYISFAVVPATLSSVLHQPTAWPYIEWFVLGGGYAASFTLVSGLLRVVVLSLHRPKKRLRCLACGYSLIGLTEPRCPECGEPFDASLLTRAARDPGCVALELSDDRDED